jgi:ankyrin repeat protein
LNGILQKGVYINGVSNIGGNTPLIYAVKYGNLEAAQFLVEHGADISAEDTHGSTALNWAAVRCDTPIVIYLLSKGANPYHIPYWNADDPKDGLPELQAKSSGCDETARVLAHLRKKDPLVETALGKIRPATSDAISLNRAVRREGLGLDYGEKTATLLQAGSDVNSPDDFSYTPLQNAFWKQKCDESVLSLVRMLLEKGADPNATNMFGLTALMLAARRCSSVDVFTMLLDKGARVDVRDFEGKTVIDILRPRVKDDKQLKPLQQMLESRLKK